MRETVSVIIPCYHSGAYIRQCAQSIIDQTFRDWRAYFVVDDPQADGTVDIIESFNEPRFTIITNEMKRTCAAARNQGYRASFGEYVAFLDSDDWWEPIKLERQVIRMENGGSLDWVAHLFIEHQDDQTICHSTDPFEYPAIGSVATILFRREYLDSVIERTGELFNERMDRADDGDLVLRILDGRYRIIQKYLYHYRYTAGSLTGQTSPLKENWIIFKMCFNRRKWRYCWYYFKGVLLCILTQRDGKHG